MSDTTKKATPVAAKMAEEANFNINNIEGTGANGLIMKVDVENAIKFQESLKPETEEVEAQEEAPEEEVAEQADPEEESKDEVKTEEKSAEEVEVVSEEESTKEVGDRVVLMFIDRRAGIPIRQNVSVLGSQPMHLIDSVMPIVAIRSEVQEAVGTRQVFNPVIPEEIFDDLFGPSSSDGKDYLMKIGLYTFSGSGRNSLRFSTSMMDGFGKNDAEKAAKHWAMAVLGNPNVSSGIYGLHTDEPGTPPIEAVDKASAREQMMSRPGKVINKLLRVPDTVRLGMERFGGGDEWYGQAYAPLADEYLTKRDDLDGEFKRPMIFGVFTDFDRYAIQKNSTRAYETFTRMLEEGDLKESVFPTENWKDFTIGKFTSGVQVGSAKLVFSLRQFMNDADRLYAEGAGRDVIEDKAAYACRRLKALSERHLILELSPMFLNAACRKVNRTTGGKLEPASFNELAVRFGDDGGVVKDDSFCISHARALAEGKHPLQGRCKKPVVRTAKHMVSWFDEASKDIVAAMSGLRSYFLGRDSSGKFVRGFIYARSVSNLIEVVEEDFGGIRPSFYVLRANPVQVLDQSPPEHVPNTLSGFFPDKG